jgi:hypothetical protein
MLRSKAERQSLGISRETVQKAGDGAGGVEESGIDENVAESNPVAAVALRKS